MSQNSQWDAIELQSLNLPYNVIERDLSDKPRLVAGSKNTYATLGGKLCNRPPTYFETGTYTTNRIDRLWVYETLDPTPYFYLISSQFDPTSGTWGLYYWRPGDNTWTSFPSLRNCNASRWPHEGTASRGLFFVKSYASQPNSDPLGTIIFDGSNNTPTVTFWGVLGPTTPANMVCVLHRISNSGNAITAAATSFTLTGTPISDLPAAPFNIWVDYECMTVTAINTSTGVVTVLRGAQGTTPAAHNDQSLVVYRGWSSSAHPVTVNFGWTYTYAYKTKTGQISNRAPIQTNPDSKPSGTGPFLNLLPQIQYVGHADTVNVPTIVIYRSTDGGGTYYKLAEVTNQGSGTYTYTDNGQYSSSGYSDPLPDSVITGQNIAPTLTSNSPPPSVSSFNIALSTLVNSITSTATSCVVTGSTAVNARLSSIQVPFSIQIDNETITVTNKTLSTNWTFTITRVNGAAHAAAATVRLTPIVGVDMQERSTPITTYSSRLWYGIDNILFFSAAEELYDGVPEESFPSGLKGNFFRFPHQVVNLMATTDALYVFTTHTTYMLTGSTLETFNMRPVLHSIGAAVGHPKAITRYGEAVVWLTNDFRLGMLQGTQFRCISDPLGSKMMAFSAGGPEICLDYWAMQEKEWLVMLAGYASVQALVTYSDPTQFQVFTYDIKKSIEMKEDFWNAPWTIQASSLLSASIDTYNGRQLLFAMFNGGGSSGTTASQVNYLFGSADTGGTTDSLPLTGNTQVTTNFDVSLITNLFQVPAGDHVNMLRRPVITPEMYDFRLEITDYGATDPDVYFYLDDMWTTPIPGRVADPPSRHDPPLGYKELIFPIHSVVQRFSLRVDKLATSTRFELQNLVMTFAPVLGD